MDGARTDWQRALEPEMKEAYENLRKLEGEAVAK